MNLFIHYINAQPQDQDCFDECKQCSEQLIDGYLMLMLKVRHPVKFILAALCEATTCSNFNARFFRTVLLSVAGYNVAMILGGSFLL